MINILFPESLKTTHCAQTFFSLESLAIQVEPTVPVGLGAAEVVEVGFTLVGAAEVVADGFTVVETVVPLNRQMFNLHVDPQMLFASPAHAILQSESEVLELAGGAVSEHQHSRPYDAPRDITC